MFDREEQDRLVAAIPRATLRVYPETGYCPNWERPEHVAADLNENGELSVIEIAIIAGRRS